jgi:hypothetical protein
MKIEQDKIKVLTEVPNESPTPKQYSDGNEFYEKTGETYVKADGSINFFANLKPNPAKRVGFIFDKFGNLKPLNPIVGSLGTPDAPWKSIYADYLKFVEIDFAEQPPHVFFSGPPSGYDYVKPTWRRLVEDDIPELNVSKLIDGILPISLGGTGKAVVQKGLFFAGSSSETEAEPLWRKLTADDIPLLSVDKFNAGILPVYHGGTGIASALQSQILIGPYNSEGIPTWRTLRAEDLPEISMAKLDGILPIAKGGTGTNLVAERKVFIANSEEGEPVWRKLEQLDIPNLNTSQITGGILPIERGGTGKALVDKNVIFAGSDSENDSAPLWRALVPLDIPELSTAKLTSGLLPVERGGTGVSKVLKKQVLIGHPTINEEVPTWRTITQDDLPLLDVSTLFGDGVLEQKFGGTGSATVAPNVFFGGLLMGSGEPLFRKLEPLDIPELDAAKISSGTLLTTRGGTGVSTGVLPHEFFVGGNIDEEGIKQPSWRQITAQDLPFISAYKINAGILGVQYGGTGIASTPSQNKVFASAPYDMGEQAPTWRKLVEDDIPQLDMSKIGSGVIPVVRGGTNRATISKDVILYGSDADVYSETPITTLGRAIINSTTTANTFWYSATANTLAETEITAFGRYLVAKAGITKNNIWYATDTNTIAETPISAVGRDILNLPSITANKIIYSYDTNLFRETSITEFGRTLINMNISSGNIWYASADNTLAETPISNIGKAFINIQTPAADAILYINNEAQLQELPVSALGKLLIKSDITANKMWYSTAIDTLAETEVTLLGRNIIKHSTITENSIWIGNAAGNDFSEIPVSTLGKALLNSTFTKDNIWYASDTNTLGELPISADGKYLLNVGFVNQPYTFLITNKDSELGKAATYKWIYNFLQNAQARPTEDVLWYTKKTEDLDGGDLGYTQLRLDPTAHSVLEHEYLENEMLYWDLIDETSEIPTPHSLITTEFGRSLLSLNSGDPITGLVADEAATLSTSRKLWGNDFNGSADITGKITTTDIIQLTGTKRYITCYKGLNANFDNNYQTKLFGEQINPGALTTYGIYISEQDAIDPLGFAVAGGEGLAYKGFLFETYNITGEANNGGIKVTRTAGDTKVWSHYLASSDYSNFFTKTQKFTGTPLVDGGNKIGINLTDSGLWTELFLNGNDLTENKHYVPVMDGGFEDIRNYLKNPYITTEGSDKAVILQTRSNDSNVALQLNRSWDDDSHTSSYDYVSILLGNSPNSDETSIEDSAWTLTSYNYEKTFRISRSSNRENGLLLEGPDEGIYAVTKGGYKKEGYSDTSFLLAGGGTALVTDFIKQVHTTPGKPLIIETGNGMHSNHLVLNRTSEVASVAILMGSAPGNTGTIPTDTYAWKITAGSPLENPNFYIGRGEAVANGLRLQGPDDGIYAVTKGGFNKEGFSDTSILLAGGGTKLITDFVQKVHNNYLVINPPDISGASGIRINRSAGGNKVAQVVLGTPRNSLDGTTSTAWTIQADDSNELKFFTGTEPEIETYGTSLFSFTTQGECIAQKFTAYEFEIRQMPEAGKNAKAIDPKKYRVLNEAQIEEKITADYMTRQEYQQLEDKYNSMVDKYNALLDRFESYLSI